MRGATLVFLMCGCAATPVKRAAERFDFAGSRATYRVFTDSSICDAEPQFVADEFLSVNEVLKRFLRDTPDNSNDTWTSAHFELMEDGLARLPPVLDTHRTHLKLISQCSYAKSGAWPEMLARADTLLDGTRARLEVGPVLMKEVKQRTALEEWNRQRLEQQESARRACPVKTGAATIYFAYVDELGQTSFLFCDGATVTKFDGGQPAFEAPPPEISKRPPSPKTYFAAVERFPKAAIMTPP
ncbi:MAG: hypothetical protein ACO1OB_00650 [Archangium sp.]